MKNSEMDAKIIHIDNDVLLSFLKAIDIITPIDSKKYQSGFNIREVLDENRTILLYSYMFSKRYKYALSLELTPRREDWLE